MTADRARAGEAPLLQAENLQRHFDVSKPLLNRLLEGGGRRILRAVDGLDFSIPRGGTYALVGESGCGKSTVARLTVGLYPPSGGRLTFDGQDITDLARQRGRRAMAVRQRLQMIFQDPYASLNPLWRVGAIIAEPLRVLGLEPSRRRRDVRAGELLEQVGLAARDRYKYPHEFSGGQRQRISIARALANSPEFIVCDEPTSALDVSVQAQILNLMRDLQREHGLTYLFISHDMAVVKHMADHVGVMYLGRIVEEAPKGRLFSAPRHPYTQMLLQAIPSLDKRDDPREAIRGEVPNPLAPPTGCLFHPRCPHANERCRQEVPRLHATREGSRVACHGVEEGRLTLAQAREARAG
ncbi:ABC transporter ATP-binding protein [Sediminicurvatus halobius]|uniref:ABC transporter ATP-binding protein n=1 Tax=Sediminicurvatus halobius TaxID=2182432 RepID=A0A2U2N9K7_9GAMM|nr:oligopeptide/dipeptide ABC transporter ATP-binding protein [Spiribacter halobius]PWG65772.1 ABC transporter ATP-binding protein [Spiribacter halobius]UEX77812.1 ATP-binding cassette domain-containing protein [Spiribacter halobius]